MKKCLALLSALFLAASLAACGTVVPATPTGIPTATDTAVTATDLPAESGDLLLRIGETTLHATLADNSSAAALRELLSTGPLTISMSDYGGFEKVGELGTTLPQNDETITTAPGDLILYLGTRFTVYYDANTWNFTRLGQVQGVTAEELRALLGPGDVTVTLSLATE